MADRLEFDEMALSLHASYLSRWNRHDPSGLERASQGSQADPDPEPEEATSAA